MQSNLGYGFTDLASTAATYQANQWYRVEVDWSTSGTIVAKVYAADGTTLLYSVTAKTTSITTGGIAFRATGSDKYFDTVTVAHSGNSFTTTTSTGSGSTSSSSGGTTAAPPTWTPPTYPIGGGSSSTTPSAAQKAAAAAYYSTPTFVAWDAWSLYLPY